MRIRETHTTAVKSPKSMTYTRRSRQFHVVVVCGFHQFSRQDPIEKRRGKPASNGRVVLHRILPPRALSPLLLLLILCRARPPRGRGGICRYTGLGFRVWGLGFRV